MDTAAIESLSESLKLLKQFNSWLKLAIATKASIEGSRRFHNHRECPY